MPTELARGGPLDLFFFQVFGFHPPFGRGKGVIRCAKERPLLCDHLDHLTGFMVGDLGDGGLFYLSVYQGPQLFTDAYGLGLFCPFHRIDKLLGGDTQGPHADAGHDHQLIGLDLLKDGIHAPRIVFDKFPPTVRKAAGGVYQARPVGVFPDGEEEIAPDFEEAGIIYRWLMTL